MNTDLNHAIQDRLKRNRRNRNRHRLLIALCLSAVLVTSTVLTSPAVALTGNRSDEVVQETRDGEAAVEQNSDGQPAGSMAKATPASLENAPAEETTEEAADETTADADAVELENDLANGQTEAGAADGQGDLLFEDGLMKITASRKDGGSFPSGMTLGEEEFDEIDAAAAERFLQDTITKTDTENVNSSIAGLHTFELTPEGEADSEDAEDGKIVFTAKFPGGLNDAGYASKAEQSVEKAEDGTSTTQTTKYRTSWRIYLVSEDGLTDITDDAGIPLSNDVGSTEIADEGASLPSADGSTEIVDEGTSLPDEDDFTDITDDDDTSLTTDNTGACTGVTFTGKLPEKVVLAQIVRKTVTTASVEEQMPQSAFSFDERVLTEKGSIRVQVDADEGTFDEGTTMTVTPVSSSDILDKAIDAAGGKGAAAAVDIAFTKPDGTQTEPAKPIRVKMTSAVLSRADEAHVVHVDDSGNTDVVAKKTDGQTVESTNDEAVGTDASNAVSFESDSFSVYAIVYTVDFHYEVNGKMYEFSIPGGGFTTLKNLIKVLGINTGDEQTDIDRFVADIKNVEFSNPELVWVGKADADMTLGQVKSAHALDCEYSAELSTEYISRLNNTQLDAGAWLLISLKPFSTEEILTVTMKDETVLTVKVTDESEETAKTGGIQIQKIIADTNGNMINLPDNYSESISFKVYHSDMATSQDVKDLNVGLFTTDMTSYLSQYTQQTEAVMPATLINKTGWNEGLYINDLPHGMYYISEVSSSVPSTITDAGGVEWHYKNSYILTEYPWRNHNNDNYRHVSPMYTGESEEYAAVPEVLGDHPGYSDSQTYTNDYLEFYVYNVYEPPQVKITVNKTWKGADPSDWESTFRLQSRLEGETEYNDVRPIQVLTLTKEMPAASFESVPRYEHGADGQTHKIEYTVVEESYSLTDESGEYTWDEISGYTTSDEDYQYSAVVGDTSVPDEAGVSTISVINIPKNLGSKKYIDVNLHKNWDQSISLDADSYAVFELKRYVRTEYRDVSDADRTADPVTVIVNGGNSLTVQPGVGLYLAGDFAAHSEAKTIVFSASPAVTLADGTLTSTITVTASGSNPDSSLVRSAKFFARQNTTFTLSEGTENLNNSNSIYVLDTGNATSPVKDKAFSRTIRLDSAGEWTAELENLLSSETVSAEDGMETVYYYEYYFEETENRPAAYPSFNTGDIDHRIKTAASVEVTNGPANRLVVEKLWRGVPDTTGFPEVTFTLYVTNNTNGNNGGSGGNGHTNYNKVYEAQVDGETVRFANIPLSGNSIKWVCPVELPAQDELGDTVYYYVQEDELNGENTNGDITTKWSFYYYRNSEGRQTNGQAVNTALSGDSVNGGSITVCNKLDKYRQMDVQKQFFEIGPNGSIGNITANNWSNTFIGFTVIRAIRTSDGKWIDERGNFVDNPVWQDYGEELLAGYDSNNTAVVDSNKKEFWFHNAGGNWHFRIEDNGGDQNDANAQGSGSGLPTYGYYLANGEKIAVEYWYSFRESGVYSSLDGSQINEWDWYSSVTPMLAYGPEGSSFEESYQATDDYGNTITVTGYAAFPKAYSGQDPKRIANFRASDLIVSKSWEEYEGASEVYVKIYRKNGNGTEDVTGLIATDIVSNNNWQGYVEDTSVIDTANQWLILNKANDWTATINKLLLEPIVGGGTYQYWIKEVAYKTKNGIVKYNPEDVFDPDYQKWEHESGDGEWQSISLGDTIQLKSKGENKLKVINSASASSSYSVKKKYDGAQSSTGGQSSVSGRYPTDGSTQVVLQLQQRYRYEKTEEGVEYVSADNADWVRADSLDAAGAWTVDWQNAESANPSVVTLPLAKPSTATISDAAWYNSTAAWTYNWEGLDIEKDLGQALPAGVRVQLYYRAVEVSIPEWFDSGSTIDGTDEGGIKAVDDSTQTAPQIEEKSNEVRNIQGRTTLHLNKEWTNLGETIGWPEGYVVEYQLVQHYHLVSATSIGDVENPSAVYMQGDVIKSVDMVRANTAGVSSDMVHPQATGTLEETSHELQLTGLPLYGFFTATEADVTKAAEVGIELKAGVTYPVVYTYSVRETGVRKNGEYVAFKAQTVDADINPDVVGNIAYKATLQNEITSITVEKKWNGLTPGSGESATIGLYRFEKEPEETTFQYTVKVTGDSEALSGDGTVAVKIYDEDNQEVASYTLKQNDWSHDFNLEIGGTYHAAFEGDGTILNTAVTPSSTSNITGAGSIDLTATAKSAEPATRSITVIINYPDHTSDLYGVWLNLWNSWWEGQNTDGNLNNNKTVSNGTLTATVSGVSTSKNYGIQIGGINNFFGLIENSPGYNVRQNDSNQVLLDCGTGTEDITITISLDHSGGGQTGGDTATFAGTNLSPENIAGQWGSFWDNRNNLITGTEYEYWIQVQNIGTFSSRIIEVNGATYRVETTNDYGAGGQIQMFITPTNANVSIDLSFPAGTRRLRTASKAPAKAPATITWTNNTDGLPEGADPKEDTLVETVIFSENTWSRTWTELPKYSEDGKEYVYYAYETDYDGASGATSLDTTYSMDEDGNWTVTNTPTYPDLGSLKVTKKVMYGTELDTDADGLSFTVGIFLDTAGTTQVTGQEDKTITVQDGLGEATFTGLTPGTYYVYEIVDGSPVTTSGTSATISSTKYTVTYSGNVASVSSGNPATATITNTKTPYSLNILKIDKKDSTKKLDGATFQLNRLVYNSDTHHISYAENSEVNVTTANGGTAVFPNLAAGYYEIKEMNPPAGYILKGDSTFYIKVSGSCIQRVTREENKDPAEWQTATGTIGAVTYDAVTKTATVENEPGVALPSTGGPGTRLFTILGSILILLSGTLLWRRRRWV